MNSRLGPSALALLLFFCVAPAWSGEGPDSLTLHTGEQVGCQIEGAPEGFVLARIGNRTYRFERANLEGAEQAGQPLPDAATVAFVQSLAPHLTASDEILRRAATAAIRALGVERADAVEAVAARARDAAIRDALRALRPESKR